jgi:hypothetical protein
VCLSSYQSKEHEETWNFVLSKTRYYPSHETSSFIFLFRERKHSKVVTWVSGFGESKSDAWIVEIGISQELMWR